MKILKLGKIGQTQHARSWPNFGAKLGKKLGKIGGDNWEKLGEKLGNKLGKNWGTAVYTRTKLATFQDLIGNVLDLIGNF